MRTLLKMNDDLEDIFSSAIVPLEKDTELNVNVDQTTKPTTTLDSIADLDYVDIYVTRRRLRMTPDEAEWLHEQFAKATLHSAPPPPVLPRVQSMVASFNLGIRMDLRKIAFRFRNAEFDPRKMNGVIVRLPNPRVTVTCFRGGRVTITGSKCPEDAIFAAKKFARLVQLAVSDQAACFDFRVESMIITADLRFPVRLEKLAQDHPAYCTYEPDVSPSLIYRHSKVVMMLFVTGRMLLSGSTDIDEVKEVFAEMYDIFIQYRN